MRHHKLHVSYPVTSPLGSVLVHPGLVGYNGGSKLYSQDSDRLQSAKKKLLFPSLITEVNVCDKFNFCIVKLLVDQIHAGAQSTLTVRWGDTYSNMKTEFHVVQTNVKTVGT